VELEFYKEAKGEKVLADLQKLPELLLNISSVFQKLLITESYEQVLFLMLDNHLFHSIK
jgi:hypothetical protein